MSRTPQLVFGVLVTTVGLLGQSGWQQMAPTTVPSARGWTHMTHDLQRGVTVMFSGWQNRPADTWEWNGANWTLRATVSAPPARFGGAFGHDLLRGRIVLFGGSDSTSDMADTWEYDGNDWTQRATTGPSPRQLTAMTYDPGAGRMILLGGGHPTNLLSVFNDTWAWDGTVWTQLFPIHSPPPRWQHKMVTDYSNGRVVLQGGTATFSGATPATLADTWTWDGADWTQVAIATNPGFVTSFGMTFDWSKGACVLFGGESTTMSSATWIFTGEDWVRDNTLASPPARTGVALAYDVGSGQSVLFGGWGPGTTSDTWVYTPPVLGRWDSIGPGCPGSVGTPTLAPVLRSRPVIGRQFQLRATNVANGFAVLVTGFSTTVWRGGPLPAPLATVGLPGCTLYTSDDLLDFASATLNSATFTLNVPASAALVGLPFANQVLSLDPGVNAFGGVLSNAGLGVVGGL